MTAIATAPTLPQIEGISRHGLFQRLLRDANLGFYGTLSATSDDGTYIEDSVRLLSYQYSPDRVRGAWIRLVQNGADAAPAGQIRSIRGLDPETGRATVSPPFTAAPTSGMKYEIWQYRHPQDVMDLVDDVLAKDVYLPYWAWASDLPNGDMEQVSGGVPFDWSAVGSATLTAESWTAGERYMRGKHWAKVVTTDPNTGFQSKEFGVHPGEVYHTSMDVRLAAIASDVYFQAYDETNDTVITEAELDAVVTNRMFADWTAPAGCYDARIRVIDKTGGTTFLATDAVLMGLSQREVELPFFIKHPDQVRAIFRSATYTAGTNRFEPGFHGERDVDTYVVDSPWGAGVASLRKRYGLFSRPMYVLATRNETAFENDSELKFVDDDVLYALVGERLFVGLAGLPMAEGDRKLFGAMQAQFSILAQKARFAQETRVETTVTARSRDGWHYDYETLMGGQSTSLYYGDV